MNSFKIEFLHQWEKVKGLVFVEAEVLIHKGEGFDNADSDWNVKDYVEILQLSCHTKENGILVDNFPESIVLEKLRDKIMELEIERDLLG